MTVNSIVISCPICGLNSHFRTISSAGRWLLEHDAFHRYEVAQGKLIELNDETTEDGE